VGRGYSAEVRVPMSENAPMSTATTMVCPMTMFADRPADTIRASFQTTPRCEAFLWRLVKQVPVPKSLVLLSTRDPRRVNGAREGAG
jgi:hypothetical protein